MNPNESENYTYLEDYTKSFCSVWDELIDWEKRYIAENGRISNILKKTLINKEKNNTSKKEQTWDKKIKK